MANNSFCFSVSSLFDFGGISFDLPFTLLFVLSAVFLILVLSFTEFAGAIDEKLKMEEKKEDILEVCFVSKGLFSTSESMGPNPLMAGDATTPGAGKAQEPSGGAS